MPMEDQVAVIFGATKGFVNEIPTRASKTGRAA